MYVLFIFIYALCSFPCMRVISLNPIHFIHDGIFIKLAQEFTIPKIDV